MSVGSTSWWKWDGVIDDKIVDYILADVDWEKSCEATIGESVADSSIRKTDVVWRSPSSVIGCIAYNYMAMANSIAGWGFEINGAQDTQISRYADGGFYDWHNDANLNEPNNSQRKLTFVMLLNDPSDFEGGALEFGGGVEKPALKKGSILVFPSFHQHKVTPVTSGVRYTAVCWATGPRLK